AAAIEEEQEFVDDDNEFSRDVSSYSNTRTRVRGRGRGRAAAAIEEEQEFVDDDNEFSRDLSSYSNTRTRGHRRGRGRAPAAIEEEQEFEDDDNELSRDISTYRSTTRARGLDGSRNRGLGNRTAIEKMELDEEFGDDPKAVTPEADYDSGRLESIVNQGTSAAMKRRVDSLFDSPTPKRKMTDTAFSILSQRSAKLNSQSIQRTQSINERDDDDDLFD
ncbi:10563_t:CDS:1, partial [Funneliformis geosporum]